MKTQHSSELLTNFHAKIVEFESGIMQMMKALCLESPELAEHLCGVLVQDQPAPNASS